MCEKSDGQRVLVLIVVPPVTGQQEVYLIDRKNMYYRQHHLFFPHFDQAAPNSLATCGQLTHTLLDGELVIDTITPQQTKLRLLLFDCIVLDGENVSRRSLGRRYARIRSKVYPAYAKYLRTHHEAQMLAPFEVLVKPMDLAYGIDSVLHVEMPKLLHGNDGLIFTSCDGPYVFGTNNRILKWKPPQENTIDFKIELRFPPSADDPSGETPDYTAMPMFQLLQHVNGPHYEPFDWLDMDAEEWETWKASGQQLDDRIVECAWHVPSPQGDDIPTWHIKRIRDDKSTGNHKSTVSRILQSIRDGVSEQELCNLVPAIRAAWKSQERIEHRSPALTQRTSKFAHRFPGRGLGGPGPPLTRGGFPAAIRR